MTKTPSKIVGLPGVLHCPDAMLEAAKGTLESCVILGRDHDGEETFATSKMDLADFIYLLERAKFAYLLAMTGLADDL